MALINVDFPTPELPESKVTFPSRSFFTSSVPMLFSAETLKQIVRTGDPADAFEAAQKLQELPKNSNPIRMHNRCKLTGRPKGYIRQFGISRIQFREMASNGLIPGVKKASW